jgi:hypothetical protein
MSNNTIEVPSVCLVYGTCVDNHRSSALAHVKQFERALKAAKLTKQGTSILVCIGGEIYDRQSLQPITEALAIRLRIEELLATTGSINAPEFIMADSGQETLEQTQEALFLLTERSLLDRNIGVVTSWHQMPRVRMILRHEAGLDSIPYSVDRPGLNRDLVTDTYNFAAGYGYTRLTLLMQEHNLWQDGGPVINHFRCKRATHE